MIPNEARNPRHLIEIAMAEDHDTIRDATSVALIPDTLEGSATFRARSPGVLAGIFFASEVLMHFDEELRWFPFRKRDGDALKAGEAIGTISGRVRSILLGERTALNFLQRLSGVATLTRQYVDAIAGLPCQLLDTRKTTPGWRWLEKYAVRCGGGVNHRMHLDDMLLVKDNHLAALGGGPDAIRQAASRGRAMFPKLPLMIEVDTLDQLDVALAVAPDFILLDNMPLDVLREAVTRRNHVAPAIKLEASGGVTLATVRGIAETGVDRISVGAITHSAPALDIALDYQD